VGYPLKNAGTITKLIPTGSARRKIQTKPEASITKNATLSDPATRNDLIQWLNTLQEHVYKLRVNQFIFKTIWKLVQENPELMKRQSHIYAWLHDMYAEAMAMAIRRLCDPDDRTVSIVRFLRFVKRDPSIISRAAYAALFPMDFVSAAGLPHEVGAIHRELIINKSYDQLVGKDIPQPRGKEISKEISQLTRLAENSIDYAHKRIAHFDKQPPTKFPTLEDIDAIIENATRLLQKYICLLKAAEFDFGIYFQYDWLAPLRVPWLPDDAVLRGGFK
jgi:hypothetical protein